MPRFRISSQQSSRGNKLLGGLRGSSNIGTSSSNTRSQSRRAYGRNARRIVSSSSYSNYTFLPANTYSVSWQTTPPIPAGVNLPSSIVATVTSASNYQLQYESVQGDNATQTYMQWYDDNMYYQATGSIPTVPGPIMKFQQNTDNTYNVMYNITSSGISGTLTPSQSSSN